MLKRTIAFLFSMFMFPVVMIQVAGTSSTVSFAQNVKVDGERVIYSVEVIENSNIAALSFKITYNSDQIQLQKVEQGDLLNNNMTTINSQKKNQIIVSSISLLGLKKGGGIIETEFQIVSVNAPQIEIDLNITECVDSNSDRITYTQNSLTIKNPLYKNNTNDDHNNNATDLDCTCLCHSKNPFSRIIWFVERLFWRIMGINQVCICGVKHY